jgi:hypothetical protein
MKWWMETLSGIMLLAALVLRVLVWRESGEQGRARMEFAAQTNAIAELRRELTASKLKASKSVAKPAEVDPQLAEVTRQLADLSKKKQQARFRQNALNNYISGFDRLKLPPEILDEAKHIIIERWQAIEDLRNQSEASARANGKATWLTEELLSAFERLRQSENEKLTALLGRDSAETLQASTREETINWEIGTDMWDAGAPISPEQVQALALAQERIRYERTFWGFDTKPSQIPDSKTGLSSQDAAFVASAAPALTTTQRQILVQSLIENNQYNASMRIFSERQKALWRAAEAAGK